MRKKSYIITACAVLILIGMTFSAPTAHAQVMDVLKVFGLSFADFVAEIFASIATMALYIMSWWVSITGALLNVSITLTLHIKDFVNSTSGVYIVWQTIRDISGLFIIFMLLYASFKIILGFDTAGGVGNLIKNIVIAGILINFSFFITSLLIDASNIVSLALYNGIVGSPTATTGTQTANCPQTTAGDLSTCAIAANTLASNNTGNLGSIFMDKLKPQDIYNPANTQLASHDQGQGTSPAPLQILIQGVVGCIIMFTVGMSFLLASLAFVARLAILIVLLAFSPIWFAAMIFPILEEKKKHFTDQLYAQLIFMPVYLLLLYAAMTVIKYTTVFTSPGTVFSGSGTPSLIPTNLIVLAINDFFILFLLNMPLVVAFGFGGHATDFLAGGVKKFGAANVWKNFGSQAGSRTVGRVAYSLNESNALKRLAGASPILGGLASKGLSNISSAGFGVKKGGYEDRLKAKKKAQDELHERIGELDRSNYATEAEFQKAQERARTYQEKYRANLPWKSSIMGFMLDNRANKQSQRSMTEEADVEKNQTKLAELMSSDEYVNLQRRMKLAPTDEEKVAFEKLKGIENELNAVIKRGSKGKGKKDLAGVIKRLAEEAKKSGGSEEGPKEEPKTP